MVACIKVAVVHDCDLISLVMFDLYLSRRGQLDVLLSCCLGEVTRCVPFIGCPSPLLIRWVHCGTVE